MYFSSEMPLNLIKFVPKVYMNFKTYHLFTACEKAFVCTQKILYLVQEEAVGLRIAFREHRPIS